MRSIYFKKLAFSTKQFLTLWTPCILLLYIMHITQLATVARDKNKKLSVQTNCKTYH